MKIAAVICEYNPFHNGHKYQLELIKRDFDAVLCIMSGSFTERGDVAVFNKWKRAEAAVLNGADLVLELGVRYSLSSAQGFSEGAVETVINTGVADALIFGSEANDIEKLSSAADILSNESEVISQKIKAALSSGIGYPAARQAAFDGLIGSDLLTMPNNILAIEYLMALKKHKSNIIPITHARTVGHLAGGESGDFASATHIREKIRLCEDFSYLTPYDFSGCEIYDINRLTDIFKFLMLSKGEALFADIPDCEPGLFNRFFQSIEKTSFEEIIESAVTKRYTRARIRRTALRAILGITGGYRSPKYLRVLAANSKGREILSKMKNTASVPIVTKTADFDKSVMAEDIRATDIASLCASYPQKNGRDFLTPPIML